MPTDFVPTRASLLKAKPQQEYHEIKFESYKAKSKKKSPELLLKNEPQEVPENIFNIKRAKQEVIKLGVSGLDPLKKEEAKIQQLIKLGAKPPKNKFKNYKELQKERKLKQAELNEEQSLRKLGKNERGKSTAKGKSFDRKRRINKEGILDIYGKIIRNKSKLSK